MEILEAIRTRRSIRRYSSKPIEFERIVALLEAGNHAPCAGNIQDWRFVVVTDKSKLKALPNYCADQLYAEAPVVIVVCSDPEDTEKRFGPRGKLYVTQNAAACTQNILLAAHGMGLGGVWIGAFDDGRIHDLFNIPVSIHVQSLVAIGYPDEKAPPKRLPSLDMLTYFNAWGMRFKNLHLALFDVATAIEMRKGEKPAQESGPKQIPVDKMRVQLRKIRDDIRARAQKPKK
jgi:nitroreductase